MKKLNKSLGQNFFNNPNLADWIVERALIDSPKTVIEIGPGDGYFSTRIAKKVRKVVLIEKDSELSAFLSQKLPYAEIYNRDILDYQFRLEKYEKPIAVYGSLPYNISKRIIALLVKEGHFRTMTFIIQREVAEKYAQTDGNSSLLSITTQLYTDMRVLKIIKPGNFIPKPKVESALIQFRKNSNSLGIDISKFERIVKLAFSNPRKTLKNNLKSLDTTRIEEHILSLRPERLNFSDYRDLCEQIVL